MSVRTGIPEFGENQTEPRRLDEAIRPAKDKMPLQYDRAANESYIRDKSDFARKGKVFPSAF